MPSVDLLVFDCDGVLVDSERLAAEEFSAALGELGLVRDPEAIDAAFRGRRLADCLAVVRDWLGEPVPADFAPALAARTRARFERDLRPVPGVHEALDRIAAELDVPLCVASSGAPGKIRHSLRLAELADRFGDALFSGTEVRRGKPAPDLFLHAARKMGVAPEGCVVIEDSAAGIAAGLAAGMRVVAYRGPSAPASRARHELDRMDALPELLVALGAGAGSGTARIAGSTKGAVP